MAQIVDRFHQAIDDKVRGEIANRMVKLAGGSATKIAEETVSTGEKYAAQVSYMQALHDVLNMCEEISADMHGTKRGEE